MAPISTLTVRLSAQIAEFQSEFRNATKSAEQFAGNFEGIATRAAAVGTFLGSIAADIAGSLARAFGQGLRDAVRLSSEFSNAFIGLSSVARAFGTDADQATQAARRLSADGLLPLKDSATGLKNLLAAGFNLEQATQLMNAFKDSAAFGRQGALSFGDAIRSATEGVKNGNSILVDNAGVTKNLSQILKEAGFSAQDLSRASTDVGVRMALFNGILKETRAQTGDAARLTETYSGQVSRLQTSYDNLLATFGAAITQNATVAKTLGAISDGLFDLNTQLVNNRNAFFLVSDAVIFLVRGLAELLNAADLIQTGFSGLQIASNRLFEAFANIGIAIFKFTERALTLQKFLAPVNFQRHAAGADEARQAYIFLEGAAQGLRDASKDAQERSSSLGNALQTVRQRALTLAKELEETRGKTVELGSASKASGSALANGLGKGAQTAKEKAKELKEALKAVRDEVQFVEDRVQDTADRFKRDFAEGMQAVKDSFELVARSVGDTMDRMSQSVKEGLQFVREEVAEVERTINSFEPKPQFTFKDVFKGLLDQLGSAFSDLERFATGRLAEFARQVGLTLAAMELGARAGVNMQQGLEGVGKGGRAAAAGVGQFAAGLIQAVAAMEAATQSASRLQNTLSGAATGAQIGASVGGGYGAIFGAIIGGIYGYIKAEDNAAAARNRARAEASALRQELLRSAGGYAALADQALLAGVAISDLLGADLSADEIRLAMRELEEGIARVNKGLETAAAGVLSRADLFARPFRELSEAIDDAGGDSDALAARLAYAAQVGQAEFERLGVFLGATFAAMVRVNGDAIGALRELAPAFDVLNEGVNEFGLTSTSVIDQLRHMFNLVTDETTGPILEAIQATGQIFIGLSDAGFMTSQLFQTVADDIGASFRELEARGGDVATAMALSQPVLQRLWEGQQIYGEITDETTARILRQAEEQGLVGAHMQDVNERILEVLIAIADVFGAQLPAAFRRASTAAGGAADDIERSLRGIRVPPISIDIEYNDPGFTPQGIPQLAHGGIVRRPTLALVGEAGPEAVVPLSQLASTLSVPEAVSATSTFILEMDGLQVAEATVPHIPGVVRRYGLV